MRMNPAQQYTFAQFALTSTDTVMTVLRPGLVGATLARQGDKIFRWMGECFAALPPRAESVGSRKWTNYLYQKVAKYFATQHMDDNARWAAWIRNLWMCQMLITDVTLGCPYYYQPHKRRWEYLYQTMTTLGVWLLQIDPQGDELGVEQYMDVVEDM